MSVENSQTATLSELADLALENKSASHKEPHTATNELILDPELKSYEACGVVIEPYKGDEHLQEIMAMMAECLSEPYSVYTYRFFVHQCPSLCWMARDPSTGKAVGSIVSRLDERKKGVVRGYIAMLAVDKSHRKKGIGQALCFFLLCVIAYISNRFGIGLSNYKKDERASRN